MYRREPGIRDIAETRIESKRARGTTFALVLVLAVALFLWQAASGGNNSPNEAKTVPEKVRARSFVVIDDAGKELGEFGVSSNGQPGIIVWDNKKSMAASIGIDQKGMPRIAFENGAGESLLELGLGEKRDPVFFMRTPDGKRRLGIIVLESGAVGIGLYDSEKRDRCMVSLGADGHPQVTMHDDQGKARVRLMVDDKGTASLDLLDGTGAERIVFQVDTQGNADAAVIGPDGKPIWTGSTK